MVMGHDENVYPMHDVIIILLYICVLPLKSLPQSNSEKYIRQMPTEGHSIGWFLKTQGRQRQEKYEELSQPRGE